MSRKLKNSQNIKVVARVRPLSQKERNKGGEGILGVDTQLNQIRVLSSNEKTRKNYNFDRVFNEKTTQQDFYDGMCKGMADDVLKGINVTICAYGTSGAGKTSSMLGYAPDKPDSGGTSGGFWDDFKDAGVVPRLLSELFEKMSGAGDNAIDNTVEYSVRISYVEIYLEKIRDLLNISQTNLLVRESAQKGVWIDGVTEQYASSYTDVLKIMRKGDINRTVGSTNQNDVSSRSHSVLTVNIEQRNKSTSGKLSSKIVFVDLAGSEKIRNTGATGLRLQEATKTNGSLSALGRVIKALTRKEKHIPYRDSKLTRLLTESLGGNSKTCLLIACTPASIYEDDTVSSLRFGTSAKTIVNKAFVNREETASVYKALLKEAESRIHTLRERIDTLKHENTALKHCCIDNNISIPASTPVEVKNPQPNSGDRCPRCENYKSQSGGSDMELLEQIRQYKEREEKFADVIRQKIEELIEHTRIIRELSHEKGRIVEENEVLSQENIALQRSNALIAIKLNDLEALASAAKTAAQSARNDAQSVRTERETLIAVTDHSDKINEDLRKQILMLQQRYVRDTESLQVKIKDYRKEIETYKREVRSAESTLMEMDKRNNFMVPVKKSNDMC